jgi:hypothetical protein
MDLLDDLIFGPLNLVDRADRVLRSVWYRDPGHRVAISRADKGGRHTLREVEDVLNRYGVKAYGRTHDSKNMYFIVKRRQARWAEYVLLHAGVELVSPTYDHRNPGYAAGHPPGWMPVPWSQRSRDESGRQPTGDSTPEPVASPWRRLLGWLDD